ncbi:MAG: DUF448 domain-containing protein [Novosphingobium sp.]
MRIPHNEPLGSDSLEAHSAGSDQPERRCILTGRNGARDELIRLAISPDGEVFPDVQARAPGRGAWIGVSRTALEAALGKGKLKGALARAFKGESLTIPDDLGAKIEAALLRVLTDRLGLEMRTGFLLLGSERISEKARGGKVAWLGHAADSSEDGARKLDQAWRVGEDAEGSGKAGMRLPLDRAALSVALGRDNVVHMALTDAPAAHRIDTLLRRLTHFLGQGEPGEPERETNKIEQGIPAVIAAGPDAMTT